MWKAKLAGQVCASCACVGRATAERRRAVGDDVGDLCASLCRLAGRRRGDAAAVDAARSIVAPLARPWRRDDAVRPVRCCRLRCVNVRAWCCSETSDDSGATTSLVSLEAFGRVLEWFGPLTSANAFFENVSVRSFARVRTIFDAVTADRIDSASARLLWRHLDDCCRSGVERLSGVCVRVCRVTHRRRRS